jgi:hypothetical protein
MDKTIIELDFINSIYTAGDAQATFAALLVKLAVLSAIYRKRNEAHQAPICQ